MKLLDRLLPVGPRSVLFGVHCWFIHPWIVAAAWTKLYGFPWDPRIWVAFFVHDLGYLVQWCRNMDGPEGETHPYYAGNLMGILFGDEWANLCTYHSRFLAKRDNRPYSRLCAADKLAIAYTPWWLYLPQAWLSGELTEYMSGNGARTPSGERSAYRWFRDVQRYCRAWAFEHADGRDDTWTGTKRDEARADASGRNRGSDLDTGPQTG